ncbi:MAG: hydroxyacylglutathione hydrolase C-terminal domain-containing protein [Gammaproteobacteria bacterium]
MSEVNALREKGTPTIPTNLELEKKTNPFLRP